MIWPNIINFSEYELLSHAKRHSTTEFKNYKSKVIPFIGQLTNENHISKVFETLIEANKFGPRRQRITVDSGLSDFSMLTFRDDQMSVVYKNGLEAPGSAKIFSELSWNSFGIKRICYHTEFYGTSNYGIRMSRKCNISCTFS